MGASNKTIHDHTQEVTGTNAGIKRSDKRCKPLTQQVTGNKVSVPWRPAKRRSQELFRRKVGHWADGAGNEDGQDWGETKEGGEEGDAVATSLDKEVRKHRGRGGREKKSFVASGGSCCKAGNGMSSFLLGLACSFRLWMRPLLFSRRVA